MFLISFSISNLIDMEIDIELGNLKGNLFCVTRRASNKIDLLYQYQNGSIASTSPFYASCGMIGKVILAVYQVLLIITNF